MYDIQPHVRQSGQTSEENNTFKNLSKRIFDQSDFPGQFCRTAFEWKRMLHFSDFLLKYNIIHATGTL